MERPSSPLFVESAYSFLKSLLKIIMAVDRATFSFLFLYSNTYIVRLIVQFYGLLYQVISSLMCASCLLWNYHIPCLVWLKEKNATSPPFHSLTQTHVTFVLYMYAFFSKMCNYIYRPLHCFN